MTDIAVRTAGKVSRGADRWAGTAVLMKLALRRERIALAAWVYGIGLVTVTSLSAIKGLYPDAAERASLAAGIGSNPAVLAVTGPVPSASIGGLTAWRIGVIGGVLVALMAIFTVIRRTRGDEESGRAELLASGVVGRAAPLAAALVVAGAAAVAIGVIVVAGGILYGQSAVGSAALGGSLAGVGIAFAGVAAIAAQLFESSRAATAAASVLLGLAFAARAVADVVSPLGFLAWLSPLGWLERTSAFGGDHLLVLLLFPLLGVSAAAAAIALLHRRDLGLALFPARLGPATGHRLGSGVSLAWRLHRSTLLGWGIGYLAFGLLIGGIADSAADLLNGNTRVQELFQQLGGAGAIVNTFLAALSGIAGLVAGAAAISAALRMAGEESGGRLEPILATGLGRVRWMAGHLLFVVAVPTLALTVGGLVAGLLHGIRSGDLPGGWGAGLSALVVQIPAAIVMGALAALLVGLLPRLAVLAWIALAVALLLGQLGHLLGLPQWLMNISPYSHVPALPTTTMTWSSVVVLLAVAASLFVLGLAGIRRRDVR